jgi:cytochrome c oxidase subunit 3
MQGSTIDESKTALNYHHEVEATGHHEEHPDFRMFGVVVFLVAESMIFLGLFTAFMIYRAIMPAWPPEGTPELELLLPGINTIILISSSFVMHRGDTALKRTMLPDCGSGTSSQRLWGQPFWLDRLMSTLILDLV